MDHVVQITVEGRLYTFRAAPGPLAFWSIESEGKTYRSPVVVTGHETPSFFEGLAKVATQLHGI